MERFDSCYRFTETGLTVFRDVFLGEMADSAISQNDQRIVTPVLGTHHLEVKACQTARELASTVLRSLPVDRRGNLAHDLLDDIGLWCWLAFVYRHQLFRKDSKGFWQTGEMDRWYASPISNWRKAQRHLVRMPVHLFATFADDADHLLCGHPSRLPEIREQLTSQQSMFAASFLRLGKMLYFDEDARQLKRGSGGKGPGSPRRLAQVRRQLDISWDLDELGPETVFEMLPSEFDRFRC